MIQLYTGVPGSGKSYKMVADLDKLLTEAEGLIIFSNINNLKLPHEDFDKLLHERFPGEGISPVDKLESFFEYEYQKALSVEYGGPLVYVLDECQIYFPRRKSMPNTEAYFQRHRHLGHYVFMATQSCRLLNANLVALIEIEYYAVRRTASFFGEFRYRLKSPQSQQVISTITQRPKKRIFELYKSFESEEVKKPRREVLRRFWFIPFLLIFGVVMFYKGLPKPPEQRKAIAAPVVAKRDPTSTLPQTDPEIMRLKAEISRLKSEIKKDERIFLPVVLHGKKMLTVDPETGAIVDILKMGRDGRKIQCVGLNCYYDRPTDGVKLPDSRPGSGSSGFPRFGQSMGFPALNYKGHPTAGPGSFVDAGIVPRD